MNYLMKKIYSYIADEITEVDKLINQITTSDSVLLTEVNEWFLKNPGKRLRPVLVLLTGKCCHGNRKRLARLAAALELLHMASLVHDDVIDNAGTRRGNVTVNVRWGSHAAVLLGDYYYAKALELAASLGDRVNKGLAEMAGGLVLGEFRQMENIRRTSLNENEYLDTISRKTAKFISLCCSLGAELGCPAAPVAEGLSLYGFYAGMAYQIIDDVLDVTVEEGVNGKKSGQDISCGVMTLPLIHALHNSADKDKIRKLLGKSKLTPGETRYIANSVCRSGAIDYSVKKALDYIAKAKGSLQPIPEGKAKEALGLLAEYLTQGISVSQSLLLNNPQSENYG